MDEINWKETFGCVGFFNREDGFFEVVSHTRAVKASSNTSPTFMVMGETETHLRISADGIFIAETPKKYVRVITPLLKEELTPPERE